MRAKKSLGQHFLTDLNIARKIVGAVSEGAVSGEAVSEGAVSEVSGAADSGGASSSTTRAGVFHGAVLEIGGGMGVLTQFLLERDDITLWGVEIDRESIAYMRERFPEFAPRLIEGDFLRFDLRERFPNGVKIIGNFPYNISSQIFFKVLENRDLVPQVVGMVQREVALRIAEPPGSRSYGILSVLLQAWYDVEYLFTVSEGVFSPPPKVKSAVIRLTRNSTGELGCDEALFVKVVKAAFGRRRKMIRNSLRAVFGEFVEKSADGVTIGGAGRTGDSGGAEHPLFNLRAEKLSVAQFVDLTNWVEAHLKD